MPGMFCRHNRLTANCPICSKELEASLPQAPPRTRAPRAAARASRTPARSRGTSTRGGGVVTRRLARAADDGYRNSLVPGLRATADAERLGGAIAAAAARLEPPGPLPEVAAEPDLEQATWRAFLTVLAGPEAAAATPWDEEPGLPPDQARTVDAYRAWASRAGSQAAAFAGEAAWSPERRFGRIFERLAFPGFGRAARFELLTALGAAGRYALDADALHLVEDDATTLAAKRLLVSGDRLLLERRARELAEACEVPLAALDRGLAAWGTPGRDADLAAEPPAGIRAALGLR
jgi:alpha-glutamyl/putrescinyl thymine pyrophosphorylase-like protein